MAHQVEWTHDIVRDFEHYAILSDEECYILESRARDNTPVSIQASKLGVSESTVHRMIRKLKRKYDVVQREHPEIFKKRRRSKAEHYMDTH